MRPIEPPSPVTYVSFLLLCLVSLFACVEDTSKNGSLAVRQVIGGHTNESVSMGSLYVEVIDNTVSVNAHNVMVRDIVGEIARQSGIEVVSNERLDKRVTLDLQEMSISDAIDRVLEHYSYTLQYVETQPHEKPTVVTGVSKLWVFSVHADNMERQLQTLHDSARTLELNDEVAHLTTQLTDGDPNVRSDAVAELASLGDTQALAAVAAAAIGDPNAAVREEAVYALADIGDPSGLAVIEHAFGDIDVAVRRAAVSSFADLADAESVTALAIVLNDQDPSMRAEAVEALGEIGGATAIRMLRQATADSEDFIRQAAAEYLAELSPPN